MIYLFNQYFAIHPYGIIRNVEWTLKTLHWRCNEINLTSRISCTGSIDRRLFECSNRELFLWCEALHWFGVWSSTWIPSRWFQSHLNKEISTKKTLSGPSRDRKTLKLSFETTQNFKIKLRKFWSVSSKGLHVSENNEMPCDIGWTYFLFYSAKKSFQ